MCLTEQYMVYSWGRGDNGRLGHGDSRSFRVPTLIEALKNEKIIKISAGEKHSACINCKFELFIWGHHKNGKLGFDSNEEAKIPTKLEDLDEYEIIDVS
jgi:alpha-tubulin suppressor-like RCC1 family protein